MRPVALVTTGPADRLGDAVALARAFRDHHPGAPVRVVVSDATAPTPPGLDEDGITVVAADALAGPVAARLLAGHGPDDAARALRPFLVDDLPRPLLVLAAGTVLPQGPLELDGPTDGVLVVATGDEDAGVLVRDAVVIGEGPAADEVLAWWRDRAAGFEDGEDLVAALARFPQVTVVHSAALRGIGSPEGSPVVPAPDLATLDPTRLGDGTPLDDRLRRLYRDAVRAGGLDSAPLDRDGATAFLRWLGEADPRPQHGGVARVLVDLWLEREALRHAYPDLQDARDRAGFEGWVADHGPEHLGLPAAALPTLTTPADPVQRPPLGVNVAGYFQSESGVGEAARRIVGALDAARIPVLPVQGDIVPPTRRGHAFGSTALEAAPFDVNLVCVNADGLPRFAGEAGPRFFDGRYTVGLWWWELPTFPDRYLGAVEHVDEVWVGSRYVQDAIGPAVSVPVVRMPLPVVAPAVPDLGRVDLGLPEGFLALFVFDFHSVMQRKNPLGAIEAFRRAFGPDDGATLVLKCINGEHHPADARRLAQAAADHDDVLVLDRFLSAPERDALLATCDVYLSLHRSEGFGLTVAEALALGRPVVATDHGGTTDFLDARNGWPVPYELVPVGPGHDPYDPEARWAEPDLDAAAAALRAVRDDPQEAGVRGAAAARRMREEHSVEAVGAVLRRRLEAIRPVVGQRAQSAADPQVDAARAALAAARARTAQEPGTVVPDSVTGLRRRLRALVTKAGRPISADVVAADQAILDALERAVEDLAAELHRSRTVHGALSAAVLAEQRRVDERLRVLEQRPPR